MEPTCRRLADAGAGAGYDGDAIGAGHSLMVGGREEATDCSFSITLGILSGRDSRQEAREGMDLRQRGLTLAAALLLLAACASLGDVATGTQGVPVHAAR